MREILFRGKRTDNGKWVYGNLVRGCDKKYAYIVEFGNEELCRNYVDVHPETVGQYTGLADKNGTKIFEGDIVLLKGDEEPYQVDFDESCFQVYGNGICYVMDNFYDHDIEVIGNIYDNTELLGGNNND